MTIETTEDTAERVVEADGTIGELSETTRVALGSIRQNQQNIQGQLGQLEIHKHGLLQEFTKLQDQAKRILDAEAERLGIPAGTSWQITADGKAKVT